MAVSKHLTDISVDGKVIISNASGATPITSNLPPSGEGQQLLWERTGDTAPFGKFVVGTLRQVNTDGSSGSEDTKSVATVIYDRPNDDPDILRKSKRGGIELNHAAFVGSPGIFISSGSITFFTSSVTSSVGGFNTQSATVRMQNLKGGGDGTSFVITGSKSAKFYFSGSTSGKLGIGTTNPTNQVDIKADTFKLRSKDGTKEVEFGAEGQLKTRKFSGVGSGGATETTGSELVMSYSPGTFDVPVRAKGW